MKIDDKKFVSLKYELTLDNKQNEIFEKTSTEEPLSFIFGLGKMLPKFEQNLSGLKVQDKFEFSLEPDEAYGEYSEKAIVNVPVDVFKKDGIIDKSLLKIDNVVPMKMSNGHILNGLIKSFDNEFVVMDFNHILAGKKLFFSGEILSIRDATKDELEHQGHKCKGCGKH